MDHPPNPPPADPVSATPVARRRGRPPKLDPDEALEVLHFNQRERDIRYAACELVAQFEGGREERSIVRRQSFRRKMRWFEARPGFLSVEIARHLSMQEWRELCIGGSTRLRMPQTDDAPAGPPPTGNAPPGAGPGTRRARPWEVLHTRDGVTSRTVVHALSATEAQALLCQLEGVSAAATLRELSDEELRPA